MIFYREKTKTEEQYMESTEVDNLFIGEFMIGAPEQYVKIYLLALMNSKYGEPLDNERIANILGLGSENAKVVEEAWKYWEGIGLIERHLLTNSQGTREAIKFKNLKFMFANMRNGASTGSDASRSIDTPKSREFPIDMKVAREIIFKIEKLLGKTMSRKELELVNEIVYDGGYSNELIELAIEKTMEMDFPSVYSIKRKLDDWKNEGLMTASEVIEHIQDSSMRFHQYREIMGYLGIRRNPSMVEKEFMDKWFDEYHMTMEDIKKVSKRTFGAAVPSIKYMEKIIESDRSIGEASIKQGNGNPNGDKGSSIKQNKDAYQIDVKILEDVNEDLILQNYMLHKRDEMDRQAKETKEMLMKQIPELSQIESDISNARRKRLTCLYSENAQEQLVKIEFELQKLYSKRKETLEAHGYKEDCYEKKFMCNFCHDSLETDGIACSCKAERIREAIEWARKER